MIKNVNKWIPILRVNLRLNLENNNWSPLCDASNEMIRYRKHKYIYLFIYNFKTHNLKVSKESVRKLLLFPPPSHTAPLLPNKPKILKKKIGNMRCHSKFTGKPERKSRVL